MTTPIYTSVVTRVKELLVGLGLTGIADANIVVTKVPWSSDMALPGIRVCREKDPISRRGMNNSYDHDYAVIVVYARVSNQVLTESAQTMDDWRQEITRLFQSHDIIAQIGIAEVFNCRVESGVVLWEKGFEELHDVGSLRIIMTAREPR
jgi:hypothetical protein